MTEKQPNPTTEAMKKALAAKREVETGAPESGFKALRRSERGVAQQNAALNKPAFRRASKRG
jgi:hypothetical protein